MGVRAVRGAIQIDANDAAVIRAGTTELVEQVLTRNELGPDDLISCVFTVTDDLDADFPAAAARQMGLDQVPLLCAREIPVPGSLERVVRVLVHYNDTRDAPAEHVYLGGAQALRPDLDSAQ